MIRRTSVTMAIALMAIGCVTANAGVMVNVLPQASPGNGIESYLVQLEGTEGAAVSTVRGFTLEGVHQVWTNPLGVGETPRQGDTNGTFGNAAWEPVDSHLLALPPINTSPGFTILESNDGTNPAGVDLAPSNPGFAAFPGTAGLGGIRFGDSNNPDNDLEATIAFLAPQPSTVDFLQVIIPAGQQAVLNMVLEDSRVNRVDIVDLVIGAVQPVLAGQVRQEIDLGGGMISMQGAFDSLSGEELAAIMVMIDPDAGDLTIDDLIITNDTNGLFGASVNGGDGSKIDLTIDLAAAQQLPPGTFVSADLEVVTNYGNLVYQLKATVPEPSSVALAGLALVGLVGVARRRLA